ncbi:hypothetical protein ACFLX7_00505 [Chloroflexota bacterium]
MYSPEVKASLIKVAGKMAVEYLGQYVQKNPENDFPWDMDNVIDCFKEAYANLKDCIPEDV